MALTTSGASTAGRKGPPIAPLWPGIQRAMCYAAEHWDTDGDGVPDGRQHNTYDIELYGPNPLSAIYYLAGLRALEGLAGAWRMRRCAGTGGCTSAPG